AYMLENAQAPVLLSQERFANLLPTNAAHRIWLDRKTNELCTLDPGNPSARVNPQNLAYVIYTSGSTGQPKGAMNSHRGICNRLNWMKQCYPLAADESVLQKTPFSFDVSGWEFFWPLISGARLVMLRPGGHRDAAYLADVIENERITSLHFVPSMLQAFLQGLKPGRCAQVARVICSGEALSGELRREFFSRMPTSALLNLYGPTETSVEVT